MHAEERQHECSQRHSSLEPRPSSLRSAPTFVKRAWEDCRPSLAFYPDFRVRFDTLNLSCWSALPASSAHRLQSVQNKALTIANIDLNTLASLQERRAAALSSLFDRILSDSVPSHLLNFCSCPSVSALSNRNLRNSAAVRLPRPKSSLLLSSPLYLAGSAFNHSCISRA